MIEVLVLLLFGIIVGMSQTGVHCEEAKPSWETIGFKEKPDSSRGPNTSFLCGQMPTYNNGNAHMGHFLHS